MRYALYRSGLLYTCDGRIRQQHMTLSRIAISLRQAAEALAFIPALSVLLPLLFGYVAGIPGGG